MTSNKENNSQKAEKSKSETLLAKFGERVRELRKRQKLSQQELAPKACLHYTHIGAVERGERNPTLQSMGKIAKGLGVDITEFFPPPRTLSPEGGVIEETVDLLRGEKLEDLQLVLKFAKAIVQGELRK